MVYIAFGLTVPNYPTSPYHCSQIHRYVCMYVGTVVVHNIPYPSGYPLLSLGLKCISQSK